MLLNTHTTLTHPDQDQTLYVVAVVSNPVGYNSRYRLFNQFVEHMKSFPNVHLTTVELAFGERDHVVSPGHNHIRLRTWSEVWHKENMLNLGIASLPESAQYIATIDGDIHFTNPHWVTQTINQLQHHMVVQLWESAIDLGPNGEHMKNYTSLASLYSKDLPFKVTGGGYYGVTSTGTYAHPGFAWAYRREALDAVGGLIDKAVVGAGDHHMALSLIGQGERSLPGGVSPAYRKMILSWQDRAEKNIRRDVGFVPGTITHYFHGKKTDRKYETRWKVIVNNQYDPDTDLKYDSQGVLSLVDHGDIRSVLLRESLRHYFSARNEDSIDADETLDKQK